MSLQLPHTLKGFSAFVDGAGYAGKCPSLKLPNLSRITEEYTSGGLDGPISMDMGQDKLQLEDFTLSEPNPEILKTYGTLDINGVKMRFKGAYKAENEASEKPLEVTVQGRWAEIDMGSFERGKPGEMKLKADLTYYKLVYAGETLIEIDLMNSVQIIGGKDMLAARRAILEI